MNLIRYRRRSPSSRHHRPTGTRWACGLRLALAPVLGALFLTVVASAAHADPRTQFAEMADMLAEMGYPEEAGELEAALDAMPEEMWSVYEPSAENPGDAPDLRELRDSLQGLLELRAKGKKLGFDMPFTAAEAKAAGVPGFGGPAAGTTGESGKNDDDDLPESASPSGFDSGNKNCNDSKYSDGQGRYVVLDDDDKPKKCENPTGLADQTMCDQPFSSCVQYPKQPNSNKKSPEGFVCARACEAAPVNKGPTDWERPDKSDKTNWQWATSMSSTWSGTPWCTSEKAHTDGAALFVSWEVLNAVSAALKVADGTARLINIATDQTIVAFGFGGNTKLAELAIMIVLGVLDAVVGIAETVVDERIRCNVRIQSMETQAIYDRMDYLQGQSELIRMQVVNLGMAAADALQEAEAVNDALGVHAAVKKSTVSDFVAPQHNGFPTICTLAAQKMRNLRTSDSSIPGSYWDAVAEGTGQMEVCCKQGDSGDCVTVGPGENADSPYTECRANLSCTTDTTHTDPVADPTAPGVQWSHCNYIRDRESVQENCRQYSDNLGPSTQAGTLAYDHPYFSPFKANTWPHCHKVGVIRACSNIYTALSK